MPVQSAALPHRACAMPLIVSPGRTRTSAYIASAWAVERGAASASRTVVCGEL
jgi:hypothetical protein